MAEEKITPEPTLETQPMVEPVSEPEVSPKPANDRLKIILFSILGLVLATGLVFGGYKLGQKQTQPSPTPTPIAVATPTPDPTANWKTYSYNNISFRYPNNWVVVFDSEVFGQPSGFNLHTQLEDSGGYQPDQLGISTFNDRSNTDRGYIMKQDRKFTWTSSGDDYIQFVVNGLNIYTGCAFYSEGQTTIDICNQILSTFRFLDEGSGERVQCVTPRPEVCTEECIVNPPYICGSDGESYCSSCQACSNQNVEWYITQPDPCGI